MSRLPYFALAWAVWPNMKKFATSLISIVGVTTVLAWPLTSRAQAVPLVFQTTFNCPDWNQTMGLGDANVCSKGDGISGYGGWKSRNGRADEITAAANYPGGGGGKGFRHWASDGQNAGGGGLGITLPSPVTKLWLRMYMRYQAGFSWLHGRPHYIKDHYWRGHNQPIFGYYGGWGFHASGDHGSSLTWEQSQGGTVGSGQWNCYEYHIDQNTGTLEFWFNGKKYMSKTGLNLGTPGLQFFALGDNQNAVAGAGSSDFYRDYDDIAISTTGYIGPIINPNLGPAAPKATLRALPLARNYFAESGYLTHDGLYGFGFLTNAFRLLLYFLIGSPL